MTLQLNEQEVDIIESLIKEGTVTRQQIDELSSKQLKNIESIKNSLFDKFYLVDNASRQIVVLNGKGQEIGKIELASAVISVFNRDDWQTWGTSVVALDEENKKAGNFYWKLEDNTGIAFSKGKAFFYNPKIEDDQYLVRQNNYIFGAIPKNKTDCLPLDLYLSFDCSLLCVTDRGAGTLYLINVNEDKIMKVFQLRNPGSSKALNVAIARKKNKIFVTDNSSTSLTIIDLQTMQAENKSLGIGVLGNIAVSPAEDGLYLLTTKPKQVLKLIDLSNYSQKKEFPLRGELFSAGDVPYDFLAASPERKAIYLMTHISEPDPFTPVITVIDSEKEKATQRFSIKEGSTPISIGFAEANPVFKERKSLLELVVDNKLADAGKIEEIKKLLQEQLEASLIQGSGGQIMEAQPGQSFAETQAQNKPKEVEIDWKIKDKPQKTGNTSISPLLDEIVIEKSHQKVLKDMEAIFHQLADEEKWENTATEIEKRMKEVEKTLKKKDSMTTMRLNDAIIKARQELEWYNLTVIRLKDLLENYHFEMMFTQEEALEMIRARERDILIETGMKTIATNCPNCDALLLGSYTCRQCGFELEKPEEALKRKLLQIATVSPFDNLKHGHLMIIDSLNHKFIEIDHFRKIVWELKKDVLNSTLEVDLEEPKEAIRLKNSITLVADYQANRVYKLTEKGRVLWELDYERSPEHKINHPISAAASENGNVIIVDYNNHRLIEVNEENEMVWRYGENGVDGIEGEHLRFPTFYQRTPGATVIITDSGNNRVIEIEDRKIIWQFGNEENIEGPESAGDGPDKLNKPVMAWRYESGNYLILDAGNYRIIEVNQEKEIIWEYRTNEGEEEYRIEDPIRAYLLKTARILIIGHARVLEVDYETKKVTWCSDLDKLGTETGKDIKQTFETVKRTKITHGMSNPYTRKKDAEDPQEREKRERLREIMESKRSEMGSRQEVNRSPVLLTPGAKVSELDFLMIDKNKSLVFLVNRKGVTTWTYGEKNELSKPQFVYYNEPNSVFIADSENKRVIEVDILSGEVSWSYEPKDEQDRLAYPRSVEPTPQGTLLISDQLGSKVIEVNKADNSVIWEYKGIELLKTPYYAGRLNKGNTLIVDWSSHIILEITPDNEVAWSYGTAKKAGNEEGCLSYPEYAQRLNNGNTLIVDTRNARIIEVTPDKKIAWSFEGQGVQKLMSPTYARRLEDGNTMIIHSNNKQVLEVDPSGKILWKYIYTEKKV